MAAMLKIKIETFEKEYLHRNRLAEENRQREHLAATQIQSWFKGHMLRAYLSHLHKKATIIQKIWRGFAARARLRQMVKAAYFIMKMNFYEEMAVRIQCRWRGFHVRKYVHNYYARKRYLEGLAMKNEQVRRELDEIEDLQKRGRKRLEMKREQMDKMYQVHRQHYLLSTETRPGVFNSPFRPAPHEMELLLRKAKPLPPTRLSPRGSSCPPHLATSGTPRIKSIKPCCTAGHWLPPITSKKKPQGPFRETEEVWQQRLCSPELSLRRQTPYTDLEEARQEQWRQEEVAEHLSDTPFLPFAKAHQRTRKYERQLLCSASIHPLGYGTKHYREEDTHRLKEKEPFKTVFNTCHVFEKFGRLYSKAGNIV